MNIQNIENYDEKQNVCGNQADYNIALTKAIDYNNEKNFKKSIPWIKIYIILWAITFTWAIIVALKVSDEQHRVIHVALAAVFSPAYLISHYLVQLQLAQANTQEGAVLSFI
jgi:hypothetical protein